VHDEPRRGVGSIDYIHGLLIAEDDLDSDENESTNLALFSTSTELTLTAAANPEPGPSHAGTRMVQVCSVQNYASRFRKLCLDLEVLQLTSHNRGDIRNDQDDNSTRSFRKAGYRQYVLHCYRYFRKSKQRVCPSCVVKTIRGHYPCQTSV